MVAAAGRPGGLTADGDHAARAKAQAAMLPQAPQAPPEAQAEDLHETHRHGRRRLLVPRRAADHGGRLMPTRYRVILAVILGALVASYYEKELNRV
jgi:hypothetical protein